MNYKKIAGILGMVNSYLIPLAKEGVKMTKTPDDDLAVAFFEGGLKELQAKLEEMAQNTPTDAPTKQ